MKQEIKTEDGKKYLYLSVHPNIDYAFISSSGKSLVFRIMGTYLKSNGEIVGKEGQIGDYISKRIKEDFVELNHRHYHKGDIIKHEFYHDGSLVTAIKIPISAFT